jgi:hypothetical protein
MQQKDHSIDENEHLVIGEEYIVQIRNKMNQHIIVPRCHGNGLKKAKEEEINEERNNQIEQYITKVANDFIKEQNSK